MPIRPALAAVACGLVVAGSSAALTLGQPVRDTTVALPRFAPSPTTTTTPPPTSAAAVPVPIPAATPAPTTAKPKPRRTAPRTVSPKPAPRPPVDATPAPDTAVSWNNGGRMRQVLRNEQQQLLRRLRGAFPWWPGI